MRNLLIASTALALAACASGKPYQQATIAEGKGSVIVYSTPTIFGSVGGNYILSINGKECRLRNGEFTRIDTDAGKRVTLIYDRPVDFGRSEASVVPLNGQTIYVEAALHYGKAMGAGVGGLIGSAVMSANGTSAGQQTGDVVFAFGTEEAAAKTVEGSCK